MPTSDNDKIQNAINEIIWRVYDKNTAVLSNVSRQLAFVEGGICWFFKSPDKPLPDNIKFILMLLAVWFVLDVLQYFAASAIYWVVGKYYECHKNKSINKPDKIIKLWWMNIVSLLLFFAKIVCLGFSSFWIIKLLLN